MTTRAASHAPALTHAPTLLTRALRSALLARLSDLRGGELVLRDALGTTHLGRPADDGLRVEVSVLDADAFYLAAASSGSVAVCEAYADGVWQTNDLVGLVRLFARNVDVLDAVDGRGLARIGALALGRLHARRRNTREGSRENIAAHYDLGNDFFSLFLDETMMYSSGIFAAEEDTLERAQRRKLARIAEKLALRPEDHLLEIGTGWGGLAIFAATEYGCRVTTTTISRAQYEHARARVDALGLSGRIEVRLDDYRDLTGRYDKLVSIEMVEAVGADHLDLYFEKLGSLLTESGLALVQAITIEDRRYAQALRTVDFIKRAIFPGSFIPSASVLVGAMARTTDLALRSYEDFGPSYARTLELWRARLLAREHDARALGYDARTTRTFAMYLAYCEGGFLERRLSVAQLLLAKPGNARASYLPGLDR